MKRRKHSFYMDLSYISAHWCEYISISRIQIYLPIYLPICLSLSYSQMFLISYLYWVVWTMYTAVFWVVLNCTIQCYATVIRDGSVIKQLVTIFTRYATHDCWKERLLLIITVNRRCGYNLDIHCIKCRYIFACTIHAYDITEMASKRNVEILFDV